MDKPVCRVCGAKHWGSEPHVFKDPVSAPVNKEVRKAPPVNIEVNALKARIAELEAEVLRLRSPVDRKAYMREYMRKRRAK